MRTVVIAPAFDAWQTAARALLREGVAPAVVTWRERAGRPASAAKPAPGAAAVRVPRSFVDLARRVARHPDPDRWRLLYTVLWRIVNERRDLLGEGADPDVVRLRAMDPGVDSRPPAAPAPGAAGFLPGARTIPALQQAAAGCTGCDLYRHATQTVFGRGAADARIVLVGEQPGDQEDRQGAPFVGPAGDVLDRALQEVGIPRARVYVTNAVKHFKFVARGKRRIHQRPTLADIAACRAWVEAELEVIRPQVLVCLGATAVRALMGPGVRVMRDHGRVMATRWAPRTMATLHPSAVLRAEDDPAQARLYALLREDLRQVADAA
jgi:DNA polymerase